MLKLNWRIARRLDSLCCAARFSESTQVPEATADVIYEKQGKTQQVFLNRPGQHNSINLGMLQSILKNAKKWNSDQSTNFITFQGKGRSFCSGGDLKSHFANWNTNSAQTIKNIDSHMKTEFTLQYYLANLRPVTISLMNGYVMGGATCLSALSPIRIVTETTKFAMPEGKIGFFVDCAGSYYLPKLKSKIGYYLATTGKTINAEQMVYLNLADFLIKSENM